jgi:GxxExxY protein
VKTAKTALIATQRYRGICHLRRGFRRIPPILAGLDRASIRAMHLTDEQINRIVDRIIGCGIEVHRELGPGLLESVYEECLSIELKNAQLYFEAQRRFPLKYKGTPISSRFQVDFVVEGGAIIELKSIDAIHPVHLAQVVTYLKLADCPAGLLMNFNVTSLRAGIRRLWHPSRYPGKCRSIIHPASQPETFE